jgi:hypothetical protein
MYRKMEAAERAALLQQLVKQLDVLEGICVGPYIAGAALLLLPLLCVWADALSSEMHADDLALSW